MAILITYPKNKIPVYWRIKLEQKDDVIYFPFRILKAVNLGQADKKILQESKALAITSLFGAQVFCDHLKKLNSTATIYVLSKKIEQILANNIVNPIKVAPSENRKSLLDELKNNNIKDVCWLIGDKAEKYYAEFIGQKIVIYENTWDAAHEGKALKIFLKQHITSALITSASNFDRMYEVMTKVDSSEYRKINYYVLGPTTGNYLQQKGLKVIYPDTKKKVLENVLDNLWHYEREN
ncbi:uroporphyrinogen-III synthase [Limosilactobacillus reuteri]|uniref:uroporphyrinogen-III synthase n=1 Tax=Limosilactobacillus reuteri TaxID=1598 RepID=UPI000C1B6634|nr:uroporphyrinogen-III synthase [Limosilactobacillus reuteri]PIN30286.1 uroporphyrinogen-III synthase [Limosilactobacillus reuteri]PUH34438.1 uroporphyrinogen-III synthase [Limosilactobacillus reuteri]PUH34446.1 uroporphyrinogen-III synthase [Limosilactobacillus reuteri]WLC95634.1 uroporphyrinogen-III synthase [Limosilactobacillus reuteri]WRH77779.1 uroporphyrinogen-III synthase [Limosilactobacillus reuteri]